jgi:hypothetical protein
MKRWWDSPEDSTAALDIVDDSDVINGVGVALLGYHGLTAAVLKPLAGQTLVDVHHVRKVLSEVDLEPIAKALGNATKSVMGDASDRYGQMLAEDIHKRAIDATERLLQTWTNTGMAWPTAIERAAEVHGVPLERLGRYAHVMKSASVAPQVRADYADRELMAYASHVGKREATADNTFISKQQKIKFNEDEHPRNPNGEFKNKNAEVTSIDERRKRLDRLNRLNSLNGLSLKNLVNSKKESDAKVEDKLKELKENKFQDKVFQNKKFAGRQFNAKNYPVVQFKDALPDGAKESDFKEVEVEHRWDKTVYIPINAKTFENIAYSLGGEFFVGQLDKDGVEAINEDEMTDYVIMAGGGQGQGGKESKHAAIKRGLEVMHDEGIFLMRSNYTPVYRLEGKSSGSPTRENLNEDTASAIIVPRAKFKSVNKSGMMLRIGDNNDLVYQTFLVDWENSDFEDFSKNLNFQDLKHFNEEHPRSTNGQFTDKNKVSDLQVERMKRLERLNRLNSLNALSAKTNLVSEQAEGQTNKKKEFNSKLFANKEYNSKKFKGVDWNNAKNSNQNNEKIPLDLTDKFALMLGYDRTNSVSDLNYLKRKIFDGIFKPGKTEDTEIVQPFINNNLFESSGMDPYSAVGVEKLVEYVDRYHNEKNWTGTREYVMDNQRHIKHLYRDDQQDDAMQDLFIAPKRLFEDDKVWQPKVEAKIVDGDIEGYYSMWEGHSRQNSVEILLGNAKEWEALKNGNATVEPLSGVNCLIDLLTGSTVYGDKLKIDDAFELTTNEAGLSNVGTNPPVDAYVIKIGQNR